MHTFGMSHYCEAEIDDNGTLCDTESDVEVTVYDFTAYWNCPACGAEHEAEYDADSWGDEDRGRDR